MKDKIIKLLENFCCCDCGSYFSKNFVEIMRKDSEFVAYKITCQHCSNSFGLAFAGLENIKLKKIVRVK